MKIKFVLFIILTFLLVPSLVFAEGIGSISIGSGRFLPTTAALMGVIGGLIGRAAMIRAAKQVGNNGRNGAIAAIVLGLISLVVGGLHAAYSAGSFGTGNGLAGAIIAILVGLTSIVLGMIALVRSRRIS